MANNIVGAEGLTANPGLVDRQRNDALLQQAIENAAREREFQAKYELEQRQMADAQAARQQQASLEAQRMARADQVSSLSQAWEQQKFAAEQANAEKVRQNELAKAQMGYQQDDKTLANAFKIAQMNAQQKEQITPYQEADLRMRSEALDASKYRTDNAPSIRKQKVADDQDVIQTAGALDMKMNQLNAAKEALKKVPTGYMGSATTLASKIFSPNDPMLGDWQTVQSALTDLALTLTQATKGSVSDSEMRQFNEAVGKGDIISLSRMGSTFEKFQKALEQQKQTAFESYKAGYGEESLNDVISRSGYKSASVGIPQQSTSFASVQEAEAANLPKGTVISVGGRRAVVD